jgi:hypothetical protein
MQTAVVGIVTRRHNGVTNWPLPILLKTITSYKSSGFTLLKGLSVVKKKNWTALQSYKSSKAITLYIATSYMLKTAFIKDWNMERNFLTTFYWTINKYRYISEYSNAYCLSKTSVRQSWHLSSTIFLSAGCPFQLKKISQLPPRFVLVALIGLQPLHLKPL